MKYQLFDKYQNLHAESDDIHRFTLQVITSSTPSDFLTNDLHIRINHEDRTDVLQGRPAADMITQAFFQGA